MPSSLMTVAAWAASPRELRVSFDREVIPEHVRDRAAGRVSPPPD